MIESSHRRKLISILRAAYSGELAAAHAYRGHWKSLGDSPEREGIQKIENDEWVHRARVGRMLEHLESNPRMLKEIRMWLTGRTIGLLCHLIGWFLPMYFAGRLESRNVEEYLEAARHAAALDLTEFEAELLTMSGVEKDHELFFMNLVTGRRLLPFVQSIFTWGPSERPEELSHEDAKTRSRTKS